MKDYKQLFLVSAILCYLCSTAQNERYLGDPDIGFLNAKELAFAGERETARDTLYHILNSFPEYTDVRTLLAKTYSWDGSYTKARLEFNKITSSERKNREAWIAAINNEFYAENYATALGLSNKALYYLGEDQEIRGLGDKAKNSITKDLSSSNEEEEEKPKNTVRVDNGVDVFDAIFDPAFYGSIAYERKTKFGKIIPRLNYSNRLEITGVQYEVDLYPTFSKTFYGYFNYGYSEALTFPNHRYGAEIYANLPKAIEISAGARYLDFRETTALVLTSSFGMYRGNYYFSARPYITPGTVDDPLNVSGLLLARKYLKDAQTYLEINLGFGYNSELQQFIVDNTLLSQSLLFVESQQLQIRYQFSTPNSSAVYGANLGVTRQELVFEPGRFLWAVSAGLNYQLNF